MHKEQDPFHHAFTGAVRDRACRRDQRYQVGASWSECTVARLVPVASASPYCLPSAGFRGPSTVWTGSAETGRDTASPRMCCRCRSCAAVRPLRRAPACPSCRRAEPPSATALIGASRASTLAAATVAATQSQYHYEHEQTHGTVPAQCRVMAAAASRDGRWGLGGGVGDGGDLPRAGSAAQLHDELVALDQACTRVLAGACRRTRHICARTRRGTLGIGAAIGTRRGAGYRSRRSDGLC